jgi:hypothetical protein
MHKNKFLYWWRITALAVMAIPTCFAQGQGFMVKPSAVEATLVHGTNTLTVEIRNTVADRARSVDVSLCELGEGPETFLPAAEIPNYAGNMARSCLSWTTVDQKAVENIPPLSVKPLTVIFKVPVAARGFYFAGLLVTSRIEPHTTGVAVQIRFLIPLLIDIGGGVGRRDLKVGGAMVSDAPKLGGTRIGVDVINGGETLGHVSGDEELYRQEPSGRWRMIAKLPVDRRRVIPGSSTVVGATLPKPLPSGQYKVESQLVADGIPLTPSSSETSFTGDPNVKDIASNVDLKVDPSEEDVDAVPGTTRSELVKLTNPGDATIVVSGTVAEPTGLQGIAMGTDKGDDFSAASWVRVAGPVSIPGGAERGTRILVALPPSLDKPYYYAEIHWSALGPDGEQLGTTTSLVSIHTKGGAAVPKLIQLAPIHLSSLGGGKYALQFTVGNAGNVHLDPLATGRVTDSFGVNGVENLDLTREKGPLLPLGSTRFSAVVDANQIKPGKYILEIGVSAGKAGLSASLPVSIARQGKNVTIQPIEDKSGKGQSARGARP